MSHIEAIGESDAIHFRCPVCERRIRAKHTRAGSVVACPACNQPVKVPGSVPTPIMEVASGGGRISHALERSPKRNRTAIIVVPLVALVAAGVWWFVSRRGASPGISPSPSVSATDMGSSLNEAPHSSVGELARAAPTVDKTAVTDADLVYSKYRNDALRLCDGVDKLLALTRSPRDTIGDYRSLLRWTESDHRGFMGTLTPAQLEYKSRAAISEAVRSAHTLADLIEAVRRDGSKATAIAAIEQQETELDEPLPQSWGASNDLERLKALRARRKDMLAELKQTTIKIHDDLPIVLSETARLVNEARELLARGM